MSHNIYNIKIWKVFKSLRRIFQYISEIKILNAFSEKPDFHTQSVKKNILPPKAMIIFT